MSSHPVQPRDPGPMQRKHSWNHLPVGQWIQAVILFHRITPATQLRGKLLIWGSRLEGMQIRILRNSRENQPPTIKKDHRGPCAFPQNWFESFPFVRMHQQPWEGKRRWGPIGRKAEVEDSLGQWKFLALGWPRVRPTSSLISEPHIPPPLSLGK